MGKGRNLRRLRDGERKGMVKERKGDGDGKKVMKER